MLATLLDTLSIGTRINVFWSASRQFTKSIYFRIGLDLDGLVPVLSFEIFLSTFVKMADFQCIKNSSDISLSNSNFPLIRMSKPSTMLSLYIYIYIFFFNLWYFFQFMM